MVRDPHRSPHLGNAGIGDKGIYHRLQRIASVAGHLEEPAQGGLPVCLVALLLEFGKPAQMGLGLGWIEGEPCGSRVLLGDKAIDPDHDPFVRRQFALNGKIMLIHHPLNRPVGHRLEQADRFNATQDLDSVCFDLIDLPDVWQAIRSRNERGSCAANRSFMVRAQ